MQRQRRMEGVLRTHRRPGLPHPCFRVQGLGLRIEVSKTRWSREVKKCPVGKDGRSWDEGDSRRARMEDLGMNGAAARVALSSEAESQRGGCQCLTRKSAHFARGPRHRNLQTPANPRPKRLRSSPSPPSEMRGLLLSAAEGRLHEE